MMVDDEQIFLSSAALWSDIYCNVLCASLMEIMYTVLLYTPILHWVFA